MSQPGNFEHGDFSPRFTKNCYESKASVVGGRVELCGMWIGSVGCGCLVKVVLVG